MLKFIPHHRVLQCYNIVRDSCEKQAVVGRINLTSSAIEICTTLSIMELAQIYRFVDQEAFSDDGFAYQKTEDEEDEDII